MSMHEQGGISVVAGLMVGVLAVLMVVVLHAGRLLVIQQEVQNSADALALAGAAALRERGGSAGDELDMSSIAPFVHGHHSKVPASATFEVVHRDDEERAIVYAEVTATVKNPFRIGRDAFVIKRSAAAKVMEWGFKMKWPAVVVMLDASGSMGAPIIGLGLRDPGSSSLACESATAKPRRYYDLPDLTKPPIARPGVPIHRPGKYDGPCHDPRYYCLYELLTCLVEKYAAKPFPARNGLVVFNNQETKTVKPPETNTHNLDAIRTAFKAVKPAGRTNVAGPLKKAGEMVDGPGDSIIIITDGDVNEGGSDVLGFVLPWWFDTDKKATMKAAAGIRSGKSGKSVNLFTIETRPGGAKQSDLLTAMAGGSGSEGGDEEFYYRLSSLQDIPAFLAAMSRRVCSFGPLSKSKQTFAFLREPDGSEEPLDRINSADIEKVSGEGYGVLETGAGDYVQLAQATCYRLAKVDGRRIVIRWGGVELTPDSR